MSHSNTTVTRPLPPVSSYRVQFSRNFTFAHARDVVPYLEALGVTYCYASPFLKSSPGSLHGYDICNHQALNPDLGAEADFDAFSDELARRHMGLILDFVPNHMGLDPETNQWWRDVLENGVSSAFAECFDIDWDPVKPELKGKILLPILGDQYGATLDRGELQLGFETGALHLGYFGRRLPIDPHQSPRVFRTGLECLQADLTDDDPELLEYLSILTALENLPPSTERDPARTAERRREKEVARERLARLVERSDRIRRHIEAAVATFNGVPHEPATFDRLHELLEALPYRLAHWRTAFDEINYRRFFDVNELGGLRMEDPCVFAATHGLVLRLIQEGKLSGLRVDHADGLFDPADYLHRLQEAACRTLSTRMGSAPERPIYLLVEKILGADETLPADWPVEGTTGYGFLNDVNGVFVDPANADTLRKIYARFTGRREAFSEIAYHGKRLITASSMASELAVLAQALNRISESHRRTRDFTLNALRKTLAEVVACFPVYRTYLSESGFTATDRAAIDFATDRARQRNPVMESSIFLFLRSVLLTGSERATGRQSDEDPCQRQRRTFAMKFQQYTAPVQAKGVEDTAYYRYNALVSLNEVGGDPRRFGRSVEEFHAGNGVRLERWPLEMIATATHDTKRGEDARARINVISEMPQQWRHAVSCWMRINASHRTAVDRQSAPDRNDEYLFYQSLLGAWPAEPVDAPIPHAAPFDLVDRMRRYMQKAIKEAKVHTSWVNENSAYEGAVSTFVETALTGPGARPFLSSFVPFERRVAALGMVNSLAQLVLKIASPGVPDFYQGTEWWDFHLVDPDNRGPVDFASRRAMLDELRPWIDRSEWVSPASPGRRDCATESLETCVGAMLARWHDARIKMFLTACGLRLRARERALMLHGDYTPLAADGIGATHLLGFARCLDGKALLAVVPRLTAALLPPDQPLPTGAALWGDTRIALPRALAGRAFRQVFTGEPIRPAGDAGGLRAADVLRTCPVALLWTDGR
jgi:(1->4)-alpha-D-glucan 1-alpha-D-glucosylmutase